MKGSRALEGTASVERLPAALARPSSASCNEDMGYIKSCNPIIFYRRLLTLCSRISFIEFHQKRVYNSAMHTRDETPVLAGHVEMSLPRIFNN